MAGIDVAHPRQHVGQIVLTLRPQGCDRLFLGHPGRQLLADDAGKDLVRGAGQYLGGRDRAGDADDREQDDQNEPAPLGAQPPDEPLEGPLEVFGFLPRADEARRAKARAMGLATLAGPTLPSPLRLLRGRGRAAVAWGGVHRRYLVALFFGAHATSSAVNCE